MKLSQKTGFSIILMLISPAFTLWYALHSSQKSYIRWMLVLFVTIYASTFNIEGIGDGTRHWQRVYDYYLDLSFHQFISDIWDILFFKSNVNLKGDLFIHVLSYLVGGVFGVPGLFFTIVGFIYGYFFSGSMVKVFKIFPSIQRSFSFFVLSIYFIAVLNIQSLNTVRTWTGFWVLFYSVISYYESGKLKYLLLLFIPPFIHVGFFLMTFPAWVVVYTRLKKQVIPIIYALSFFTTFVTPQVIVNSLNKTELGESKVQGYYVENQAEIGSTFISSSNKRWYHKYKKSGIPELLVVLITVIFIGPYLKDMNLLESKLFSIGLLNKVLSNVFWFLFAVENRSEIISILFVLAAILIYWQRNYITGESMKLGLIRKISLNLCVILIIPVFAYYLSNFLEYLSVYIFMFPVIAWIDESLRLTVRETIGFLL